MRIRQLLAASTVQLVLLWYGALAVVAVLLLTPDAPGIWHLVAAISIVTLVAAFTFWPGTEARRWMVLAIVGGPVLLASCVVFACTVYGRMTAQNQELLARLVKRHQAAGEAAVLNCFDEPFATQRVRATGAPGGSPGGFGEFVVACSRHNHDDGTHFSIEVGNPNEATYHRISFFVAVKRENKWRNVLQDPSKPSVFMLEDLGPGEWKSFQICPPLEGCPLDLSDGGLDKYLGGVFTGLNEVSVSPNVLPVRLDRPPPP